jgi:hypothetical protein
MGTLLMTGYPIKLWKHCWRLSAKKIGSKYIPSGKKTGLLWAMFPGIMQPLSPEYKWRKGSRIMGYGIRYHKPPVLFAAFS